MLLEQWLIFGTLLFTLILFINGRWRYDVVALIALLIVTLTGLVPADQAFSGFSNPAVVTVAAVLVLSRGLQNSGLVDLIGQQLARLEGGVLVQLAVLTGICLTLSAFMNNVGALALLLPVTLQLAARRNMSPSIFLMPLAFASLLGGMTTLIGTPPNIIASSFREQNGAPPFNMFDFTPVGLGVALTGLAFIVLVGWRLIPQRRSQSQTGVMFEIETYTTEVRLSPESKLIGKRLREINQGVNAQLTVVGLVRNGERMLAPSPQIVFQQNDILIISADTANLEKLINGTGLKLVGSEKITRADLESDEVSLIEAVIMPNSLMVGETAFSLNLRQQHDVNLLAIARQGVRLGARLDRIRFQVGDVLLLQSHTGAAKDVLATLGCLPLAARDLRIGQPRRLMLALIIFGGALLATTFGQVAVQVAFLGAVVAMLLARLLTLREAYDSVDWPIIVLLGAMIPLGVALETTGGAQLIAEGLLQITDALPPAVILVVMVVATMFLSDLVNNAAAVVVMAPIGISIADGLAVSVDPFLIAIALGASCAFLTPIGHQSNTLVMGPGGYRFGDYWRMGLLLEIIVVLVATPLILFFWPLLPA
ncbi:MAG: anion permease [Anaerolineae bacterium]|nr:anion permease [Anaerolineae bacterium]